MEKKKFILAVPTIIIIIVVLIGVGVIFYNRNFKKMSREDVILLSKKVANINNISCEVIYTNSSNSGNELVENYKLKDGVLVSKSDGFVIYDNSNNKTLLQIDENNNTVYSYAEYSSEIDNFRKTLFTAETLLSEESNEYVFKKFETFNGVKCVNFEVRNSDAIFEFWIDRKTGMMVRLDTHYESGESSIDTKVVYRYQIDVVTDEDVSIENIQKYEVIDM